jgi:hypothetical protein
MHTTASVPILKRVYTIIVLPHEKLYLDHLPNADQYYKSFMHRDVVNFSVMTAYDSASLPAFNFDIVLMSYSVQNFL